MWITYHVSFFYNFKLPAAGVQCSLDSRLKSATVFSSSQYCLLQNASFFQLGSADSSKAPICLAIVCLSEKFKELHTYTRCVLLDLLGFQIVRGNVRGPCMLERLNKGEKELSLENRRGAWSFADFSKARRIFKKLFDMSTKNQPLWRRRFTSTVVVSDSILHGVIIQGSENPKGWWAFKTISFGRAAKNPAYATYFGRIN